MRPKENYSLCLIFKIVGYHIRVLFPISNSVPLAMQSTLKHGNPPVERVVGERLKWPEILRPVTCCVLKRN